MCTRRGFTLIELLVVIAIIAILAAVLFPVFTSAKKKAQMAQCLSNLKQLSQAMRCYADDNSSIMPHDWNPSVQHPKNWCGCVGAGGWVYPERGQIWRYVRAARVYRCPSDLMRPAVRITPPTGLTQRDYPLSYSMNHNVGSQNADVLTKPTKRMLLMHENRGEQGSTVFAINDGTFVPLGQDAPGVVHYEGTTLSYLDMHVAWKSRQAIITEMNLKLW